MTLRIKRIHRIPGISGKVVLVADTVDFPILVDLLTLGRIWPWGGGQIKTNSALKGRA